MQAVVTGSSGFIGAHLTARLLEGGHDVTALDRVPARPRERRPGGRLRQVVAPLAEVDLSATLDGVDAVFHLAGRPGVRPSWGSGFDRYLDDNLSATQRLLEAARHQPRPPRLVVASSSSVYGELPGGGLPVDEEAPTAPRSPYGVTKLAVEHLCRAYAAEWGVPSVLLRLFSVYGPGQRPDMALHRICEAALGGPAFELLGSGAARRDLTYVDDVVTAMLAAVTEPVPPGTVLNVAGGTVASLRDLIALVEALAARPVPVVVRPPAAGDVTVTSGDVGRAARTLGWRPSTPLADGVGQQLAWHRGRAPATIAR